MTIHIIQHFAEMDQTHGDEEECRDDTGNDITHKDMPGNLFFL